LRTAKRRDRQGQQRADPVFRSIVRFLLPSGPP
jgi:hypothetical protein